MLVTGEVFAVGWRSRAKGFGTVLWQEKPREPTYFVTEAMPATDEPEIRFLGGSSLANVRLQVDDRVLSFDGSAWVVDHVVAEGSLPNVWFGAPLVRELDSRGFARLTQSSPWQPLEGVSGDEGVRAPFAVDPAGTIWATDDDLLLSSKEPATTLKDISEADLLEARKARGLRRGAK